MNLACVKESFRFGNVSDEYISHSRRGPRLRHDVRKPRPSSVDNLNSEMSYVTESEDVFYTYRHFYFSYTNATIHEYH